MSIIDELKEIAIGIVTEAKETKQAMDEISEWDSMDEVVANVKMVHKFFGDLTAAIKEAGDKIGETAGNDEKLAAAIEAAKELVDWPPMTEYMLGLFLQYAIKAAYHSFVKP